MRLDLVEGQCGEFGPAERSDEPDQQQAPVPGPLGQRCRRRDHPTRQPQRLARLTPATDCLDQPLTTRTRGTPHPVTTTGQLSHPYDRIRPTR